MFRIKLSTAFRELKDCLQMTTYIMNEIKVNEHILDDDKYLLIFSVEEVNLSLIHILAKNFILIWKIVFIYKLQK